MELLKGHRCSRRSQLTNSHSDYPIGNYSIILLSKPNVHNTPAATILIAGGWADDLSRDSHSAALLPAIWQTDDPSIYRYGCLQTETDLVLCALNATTRSVSRPTPPIPPANHQHQVRRGSTTAMAITTLARGLRWLRMG